MHFHGLEVFGVYPVYAGESLDEVISSLHRSGSKITREELLMLNPGIIRKMVGSRNVFPNRYNLIVAAPERYFSRNASSNNFFSDQNLALRASPYARTLDGFTNFVDYSFENFFRLAPGKSLNGVSPSSSITALDIFLLTIGTLNSGVTGAGWETYFKTGPTIAKLKELEKFLHSSHAAAKVGNITKQAFLSGYRTRMDALVESTIPTTRKIVLNYKTAMKAARQQVKHMAISTQGNKVIWVPRAGHAPLSTSAANSAIRKLRVAGSASLIGVTVDAALRVPAVVTADDPWEALKEESAGAAGSLAGRMFGSWFGSTVVCNFVFGVPSGGTSLLWCGFVGAG